MKRNSLSTAAPLGRFLQGHVGRRGRWAEGRGEYGARIDARAAAIWRLRRGGGPVSRKNNPSKRSNTGHGSNPHRVGGRRQRGSHVVVSARNKAAASAKHSSRTLKSWRPCSRLLPASPAVFHRPLSPRWNSACAPPSHIPHALRAYFRWISGTTCFRRARMKMMTAAPWTQRKKSRWSHPRRLAPVRKCPRAIAA